MKRIAKKALNLPGNDGLKFYEFELIADEKKFKEEYSLTLNQLPINPVSYTHLTLPTKRIV